MRLDVCGTTQLVRGLCTSLIVLQARTALRLSQQLGSRPSVVGRRLRPGVRLALASCAACGNRRHVSEHCRACCHSCCYTCCCRCRFRLRKLRCGRVILVTSYWPKEKREKKNKTKTKRCEATSRKILTLG